MFEKLKHNPKWVRYTLIGTGVLIVLLIVATLITIIWLGPIVERRLERNDPEYIGREIDVDNLSIMLFSGEISADNIVLYDDDDITPYIYMDHIYLEIETSQLFDNHLHITKAITVRPCREGIYLNNAEALRCDIERIGEQYMESIDEGDNWLVTVDKVSVVI